MAHRPARRHRGPAADETFERISDDGQRILFSDNTIWDNGALVSPPLGAVMSKDLRFAVYFRGFLATRLRRWELATRTITDIGPADLEVQSVGGMSDDGAIAWYTVQPAGAPCQTHFIQVGTGEISVHDFCDIEVSASGRHGLRGLDIQGTRDFVGNFWGGPTRLQLIDTATPGTVLTEATATPGSHFTEIHLSDTAPVFWAADVGGRVTSSLRVACRSARHARSRWRRSPSWSARLAGSRATAWSRT